MLYLEPKRYRGPQGLLRDESIEKQEERRRKELIEQERRWKQMDRESWKHQINGK